MSDCSSAVAFSQTLQSLPPSAIFALEEIPF
jgi:hypothetical protein